MSSNFEFLREVKVEGFYAIKSIALGPFSAENRWIFLTGENGYGKTLLLEAIALSLHGRDEATISTLEGEGSKKVDDNSLKIEELRREIQTLTLDNKTTDKYRISNKEIIDRELERFKNFGGQFVKLYDKRIDSQTEIDFYLVNKAIDKIAKRLDLFFSKVNGTYKKILGLLNRILPLYSSMKNDLLPYLDYRNSKINILFLDDCAILMNNVFFFIESVEGELVVVFAKMLALLKSSANNSEKNIDYVGFIDLTNKEMSHLEQMGDEITLSSKPILELLSGLDEQLKLVKAKLDNLSIKDHQSALASILEEKETKAEIQSSINHPAKNVIAYGSSRLVPREVVKQAGAYNMVRSLFKTGSALRDIEDEYINWYNRQSESSIVKARYESVKNLFEEVVPELELVIRKDDSRSGGFRLDYKLQNENTDNELLAFNRLSAGYRNILAILGDLVLNLYELQPTVTDIKALGGIVLIDELELHLHPNWQHKLPKLLSDAFPNVQFIASTHSPIPLLGAPEGAVFLKVDRDQERGIFVERLEGLEKEIEDLLPNTVLSSPLFGLKDLRSIKHKEESDLQTESNYQEIEDNKALNKKLFDLLNKKKQQGFNPSDKKD